MTSAGVVEFGIQLSAVSGLPRNGRPGVLEDSVGANIEPTVVRLTPLLVTRAVKAAAAIITIYAWTHSLRS
jgi:hypothetical protein